MRPRTRRRAALARLLVAGAALAGWTRARATADPAAGWPGRGLRLLVAYPAGGVSDEVARRLAARLAERLGVPVVVENRAGGGGGVAMAALARARPDGRTLAFSAVTPLTLLPLLQPVSYQPGRDIAPIAAVMATPVLVVGTPALAAGTLNEALAGRPAAGGAGLRWASTGVGTTGHQVMEAVRADAAVPITAVPYKGGGQPLTDALAGHFELLSTNVAPQQLELVRSGRLRALAVGAPQRLAVLPAVPTLAELGHPRANLGSTFGVFAPGATPPALRARVQAAVRAVLAEDDFRQRLRAAGNLPLDEDAPAFAARIAAEAASHRALLAPGR
ncbi:tripartite tricarboxylate transporter substrate binding protein [Piscinibacter sakaiensis]|uniref:Putative exported protein n=1 Tax=Piscinibacter sakaiensis TaxID=1547922 RepID=A0A0K8P3I7_PISS1|nr:tripartite tricarboxylate transporter substrate binding protein [Piscinibacter sakaiensis]GAP36780.1 putative exported protein [Piscinibacter sakaiensis]